MDAALSCPICLGDYQVEGARRPKQFPCGHGMCGACLVQLRKLECAQCKAPIKLKSPWNYALISVLELVIHKNGEKIEIEIEEPVEIPEDDQEEEEQEEQEELEWAFPPVDVGFVQVHNGSRCCGACGPGHRCVGYTPHYGSANGVRHNDYPTMDAMLRAFSFTVAEQQRRRIGRAMQSAPPSADLELVTGNYRAE